jgi:DinB superfamily
MDINAAIQFELQRSHKRVQQCIADLSLEEARRSPILRLSPVVWQVGHLAFYDALYAERAGVSDAVPVIPEDYERLFKAGTGGQAAYPSIDHVWNVFDRTHTALQRIAASGDLAKPVEGQPYKDVGGMLMFASAHRTYHIGKMTTLRALLDKPVLFGPPSPAQDATRR